MDTHNPGKSIIRQLLSSKVIQLECNSAWREVVKDQVLDAYPKRNNTFELIILL